MEKFHKILGICLITLSVACILTSCNKIPFLSSHFLGSESSSSSTSLEISYKIVTVDALYDELHNNILRAERTYQNEYVELSGELESIDSSGKYFLIISPDDNSIFSFSKNTVYCSITDDSQLNALLEKNVGDSITVRGQITKVKEKSGYTLSLIEIVNEESEVSDD